MKGNKEEKDHTSDSLDKVEPIAWIGIAQIVGSRLNGDYQAIDGVVDERYKDTSDFNEENIRNGLQILNGVIEVSSARNRLRVSVKMFQKKNSERDYSGQLM